MYEKKHFMTQENQDLGKVVILTLENTLTIDDYDYF